MNQNVNLNDLFASAVHSGVITQDSSSLLLGNLGAVVIAGAAGTAMEDIVASDVTLITVLIDASSSIAASRLEDAVRDGQNALLDALSGTKECDSILLALWTFNDQQEVKHSY